MFLVYFHCAIGEPLSPSSFTTQCCNSRKECLFRRCSCGTCKSFQLIVWVWVLFLLCVFVFVVFIKKSGAMAEKSFWDRRTDFEKMKTLFLMSFSKFSTTCWTKEHQSMHCDLLLLVVVAS